MRLSNNALQSCAWSRCLIVGLTAGGTSPLTNKEEPGSEAEHRTSNYPCLFSEQLLPQLVLIWPSPGEQLSIHQRDHWLQNVLPNTPPLHTQSWRLWLCTLTHLRDQALHPHTPSPPPSCHPFRDGTYAFHFQPHKHHSGGLQCILRIISNSLNEKNKQKDKQKKTKQKTTTQQ